MGKLKPCPRCGSEHVGITWEVKGRYSGGHTYSEADNYEVFCEYCYLRGPYGFETFADAVDWWNERGEELTW